MRWRQNGITADLRFSKKARFEVGGIFVYFFEISDYIFRKHRIRIFCVLKTYNLDFCVLKTYNLDFCVLNT